MDYLTRVRRPDCMKRTFCPNPFSIRAIYVYSIRWAESPSWAPMAFWPSRMRTQLLVRYSTIAYRYLGVSLTRARCFFRPYSVKRLYQSLTTSQAFSTICAQVEMCRVSTVLGRYLIQTLPLATVSLSSAKECLKVETNYLTYGYSYSPVCLIFSLRKVTVSFDFVVASSMLFTYSYNSVFDSLRSSSAGAASYIFPSLMRKRLAMALRASRGSFLERTVLMRSGMSALLRRFMVLINFFCCISLSMAMFLANSSRVRMNPVLLLVKLSQLTKESLPVSARISSKCYSISSIFISVMLIQQLYYHIQILSDYLLLLLLCWFRCIATALQKINGKTLESIIMNVHGLNDLPQPNSERQLQPRQRGGAVGEEGAPWDGLSSPVTEQQLRYAEQNRVLFISGSRQLKNPRDENYWDMLVYAFCPTWDCLSVTMLILLADAAMFTAEAIYGINAAGDLLQISDASLRQFGANNGLLVHQGQVYRLLSAVFVHVTFAHFIGNIFSTFILVTRVEHTFGPLRTLAIYVICGIGGNIFSVAVDSNNYEGTLKAGASTALFGMIGVVLGYIVINWVGMHRVGDGMRCNIICVFFFLLIFILIFTPNSTNKIDYYGHLGGFLTGIWVTGFLQSLLNETRQKVIKGVFVVLFVIQFAATFLGFFLTH